MTREQQSLKKLVSKHLDEAQAQLTRAYDLMAEDHSVFPETTRIKVDYIQRELNRVQTAIPGRNL